MSNHASWIELFGSSWLGTLGPFGDIVSFVAKDGIKKFAFVGTISKCYQAIFIKRDSKESRANTLMAIQERVKAINEGLNFGKI